MTTLSRRLRKLESRFDLGSEPVVHVIQFVESDGTVVDTLTLIHGAQAKARPSVQGNLGAKKQEAIVEL